MKKLFQGIATLLVAALLTGSAYAASVPFFTGPAGTNPIDPPNILGAMNSALSAINSNLAPPNVGLTPVAANGHIQTGATPPVLTSCGTTPAVVGSDTAGQVTMGTTATGCVITFATTYVAAPFCVVTWQGTPLASQSYVVAAATITLTQTSTSSNKVNYLCVGQQGG